MRGVFATEEIATSIANELRLKLGARRRYTDNPRAFELYLRGRNAFDRGATRLALQYFEQATAGERHERAYVVGSRLCRRVEPLPRLRRKHAIVLRRLRIWRTSSTGLEVLSRAE